MKFPYICKGAYNVEWLRSTVRADEKHNIWNPGRDLSYSFSTLLLLLLRDIR